MSAASEEIIKSENTLQPDYALESLPEYKLYSNRVLQCLEELQELHIARSRSEAIMKTSITSPNYSISNNIKRAMEQSIIEESHIVFATLNTAGHPCLDGTKFRTCIVDEAGQALESSLLIPLRRGVEKLIMIGYVFSLTLI